jgi:hypothetical protein
MTAAEQGILQEIREKQALDVIRQRLNDNDTTIKKAPRKGLLSNRQS